MVITVDVKAIGADGTKVGLATINGFVRDNVGLNRTMYNITDWLGLVPFAVAGCFGLLGLWQLIKRKSILKVDFDVLALGVFYALVIGVYLLFEVVVLNYRPFKVEGVLEASYPSSTTMLVIAVMTTAIMALKNRIKNKTLKVLVNALIIAFMAFMVIGRIIAGVHWISDIIGGALISTGLVLLYYSFTKKA